MRRRNRIYDVCIPVMLNGEEGWKTFATFTSHKDAIKFCNRANKILGRDIAELYIYPLTDPRKMTDDEVKEILEDIISSEEVRE